MNTTIQIIHNSISILYLITIVFTIIRSYFAWRNDLAWRKRDRYIALGVVLTMYMQLLLGLYLFFDARYFQSGTTLDKSIDLRFWPVEHFFIMIFALLTAQMGLVIVANTRKAKSKYKSLLIYFGISLILVFVSLTMILME